MRCRKTAKALLVFLVFAMLTMTGYTAEARASERFSLYSATVTATSDGNLSIRVTVQSANSMNTIGADRIDIQRYNGSKWITEYTLTTQNTSDLQVSNSRRYAKTHTYSPSYSGVNYRAVLYAYAEDDAGSSTVSRTSNEVHI